MDPHFGFGFSDGIPDSSDIEYKTVALRKSDLATRLCSLEVAKAIADRALHAWFDSEAEHADAYWSAYLLATYRVFELNR